jgi:hypothetical protein
MFGRATLRAVKSLAITKTAATMAASATTTPLSKRSGASASTFRRP